MMMMTRGGGGGGGLLGLLLTLTAHGWSSQAMAEEMRKAPKIIYHDGGEYFHSKQISNNGKSLLIGSQPEEKYEDSNTELLCVKHNSNVDNYYKEEYHLKVFETKRDYQNIVDKRALTYGEYFFPIKKESWSCHKTGDTNAGIMMIVNEYVGIREIFEIKYYDGIEVNIGYTAKGDRTARVKEIRFFAMADKDKALRFEGTLYYEDEGKPFYNIPNYRDVLIPNNQLEKKTIEQDGKQVDLMKEVTFLDKDKFNETVVHEGHGQILRIGSPWTKEFGNSTFVSACTPEQGLNPFPFEFRPQVYDLQIFNEENMNKIHSIDAQLTDKYFTQYFISVREEVWNCIPAEGGNFLRIVNEVVGRIPVKKINHYNGITEAYTLFLEENNQELGKKSIRFTEVKYVDPVTKEILKYDGYIRFIEDSTVSPVAQNNIAFRLNTNRLFRAQISAAGYDLRVGSRWVSDIGNRDSSVRCAKNSEVTYSKTYNTKFRVKVVMTNGEIKTHRMEYIRKYSRKDFYKFIKEEFLQCTGSATINGKQFDLNFLRVLNEIEVFVPVHQVEFFDGIEIFEKVTSNTTKSVRIREIKYLDPGNLNVLKYEGAIELPDSSTASRWPEWRSVEVSVEDVFWRIGHFSGKKQPGLKEVSYILPERRELEDYNFKIKPYKPQDDDNKSFYYIILGNTPYGTVGTATDIVVCSRVVDASAIVSRNPYFRVYRKPTGAYDSNFNDNQYWTFLDKTKQEYFVCRGTKSTTEFRRVEREYYLVNRYEYQRQIYQVGGIKYHDAEKVWYEVKGIGKPVAVAVKEVLYYAGGSTKKYEGDIILDDDDDAGDKIKKSGTEEFKDVAEQLELNLEYLAEDIKYRTDWRFNYHETYVSDASVNLQIGSKWEKEHAYEKDLTCKETAVSRGQFDAVFRTRIVQQGYDVNNQILFEEYFDSLRTESWKCTDPENVNDGGILRIVNHFAIKRHHCGEIGKLWHWDGVTVLLGDYVRGTTGCMEIVEIKYLDLDFNPIKFRGKLQLLKNGVAVPKKVTSIRLTDVARIEVHNQPQANMDSKIFMTEVSDKGINMVVGSLQTGVIKMKKAVCSQVHSPDAAIKKQHRTAVEVNPPNQSPGSVDIQPVIMTDAQFAECFKQDLFEIWNCKSANGGAGEGFQRVVNIISPKDKCSPARVYHHNGVTVQQTLDAVKIKEVKYIKDGSNARFEGFLDIVEVYHKTSDDDTLAKSSVEISYILDTPYLFYTKIKDIGVLLEVGSRWEKPWGNVDSSVLCRRRMNHQMTHDYNTKVYGNVEGLENVRQRGLEMTRDKFREYFDVLRQEVWECSLDESDLADHRFLRVVNFNIALKNISRIYHPDGITVGTQVFPDNTKSVQIKEVKYVSEDGKNVYRFDGQIVLETVYSNRHTKLFQMPNPFRRFNVETTPPGAVSGVKVKYWSVDILRVHALRLESQLMDANANNTITTEIAPVVKYTTMHQIDVMRIAEGFDIKMKVGSKWDRELKETSMTCILDKWNPTNKRQFLTEIYLYFGDDKYVLNYDTIQEYFIIKSIQVWICVSVDNTMLRVVTTLEGVNGVWMVLYRDGVEVTPKPLSSGGQSVTIVETKYMDPKDFKVLKYTGELKLVAKKDLEERKEELKKTEIKVPKFRMIVFENAKKLADIASESAIILMKFLNVLLRRNAASTAATGN